VLYGVWLIVTHGVSVPYWDAWQAPGLHIISWHAGTLTWADLFQQHNEHRVFFPLLLVLIAALPLGWDYRLQIGLDLILVCGALGLLFALLKRTIVSPVVRAATFAGVCFLLFSPRNYENFLTGLVAGSIIPTMALLAMLLVNLSQYSLGVKTLANAVLAVIASYSFASGMFVWLLGFPITGAGGNGEPIPSHRSRWSWRTLYLLFATACIAGYFVTYRPPPHHPMPATLAQWPELMQFLLFWIGNLFLVPHPSLAGQVLLALFCVFVAASVCIAWRGGDWRAQYPWIVLGLYGLMLGAATARGRVGFGHIPAHAFALRYTIFSVLVYIAIAGLAGSLFGAAQRPWLKRSLLGAAVAGAMFVALAWTSTTAQQANVFGNRKREHQRLRLAMQFAIAIPTNPDLKQLNPDPVVDIIAQLAKYDALRPPPIANELARQIQQAPRARDASAGVLEEAAWDPVAQRLRFKGWALIPGARRAADCVVVGYEAADGTWTPFTVFPLTVKRADVAAVVSAKPPVRSGFEHPIPVDALPRTPLTFRAWAIDLQNPHPWPMDGFVPYSLVDI
jgi:hypothetical protein